MTGDPARASTAHDREAQRRVPRADTYRPEIQGLRTVAALLVAAYHIWFRRVSGGVDVFFVVSGFLITGSLFRQVTRDGRITLLTFWAGLATRLLPAALLVIACASMATYALLPRVLWGDTIREAIASALYVENWQLALTAVDYLAQDEVPGPFRHFWALAVQGQFYLAWPLLMIAAARAGDWFGRSVLTSVSTMLLSVFAVSLAFSVYATSMNQPVAYFHTFARVWEFALGGLVAVHLTGVLLSPAARTFLGWVGLLAIVSCGMLFPVSRVFPGFAALWPTVGAALVLIAGTSGSRFGADHLLSGRLLTGLGDISYAFYLWHWPLLVFWLNYTGSTDVSFAEGVLLMALAGGLAWLTTRYLEAPIRHRRPAAPPLRRGLVAAGSCVALVAGLGVFGLHARALRAVEQQATRTVPSREHPGATVRGPVPRVRVHAQDPPIPGPFSIKRDLPVSYRDGCHQDQLQDEVRVCEYGRPDARHVIALVGGSHSAQWLPALQVLAETHDVKIYNMTKSGCWLSDDQRIDMAAGRGGTESCVRWNRMLIGKLAALAPDAIFTVLTRTERDVDAIHTRGVREHVPDGYLRKWQEIAQMGITILAVRDTPWNHLDPSQCIDVFGVDSPRCQMSRGEVLSAVSPIEPLRHRLPAGMMTIDLSDYFCADGRCQPVIGNVLVYRDRHHISATYMRTLAPSLAPHLAEWMRQHDSRVAAGTRAPLG